MTRKKNLFILGCICTFIILLICAFYNGLVVRKYVIKTNKLPTGESIRIVLIADLHSHIYGKDQTKIVSLIKKQNPDIIALAGDIADDAVPLEGTEIFLKGLKGSAPIYYVTGNHEFWSKDIKNIRKIIRKYNINILENTCHKIKVKNSNIIIGGVDDPSVVKYEKSDFDLVREMDISFSKLQKAPDFKILLAHRPELIEIYKEYKFDLVLSGHSHGGQVRIPFILNGLFAPNQGWFPKYAGGEYKHDTLTHIVSRGVSYNRRVPRIFNPPEVVVIDIVGKKQIKRKRM